MGLINHLISWRNAMPDQPDDTRRLRKAHYDLEHLPAFIAVPQHFGQETDRPKRVAEATIDDIAFAIIVAEQKSSAAYRRSAALKRLYQLAREAGGFGTDRAVASALKREGR